MFSFLADFRLHYPTTEVELGITVSVGEVCWMLAFFTSGTWMVLGIGMYSLDCPGIRHASVKLHVNEAYQKFNQEDYLHATPCIYCLYSLLSLSFPISLILHQLNQLTEGIHAFS